VQPGLISLLPRAKFTFRKEASGLSLFSGLFYTREVRGSNPLSPTDSTSHQQHKQMAIIVYLDQSILSNLVKLRRGEIKSPGVKGAYSQLFDAIQSCNRKGCHVFPESMHHMLEAQFDSRLSDDEWHYLKGISRGLQFEDPSQIVDIQMERALDQYLHYEEHQRGWWEGIFNRNPHEPWTPEPYEIDVRFILSPNITEHDRSGKKLLPRLLKKIAPITSARTLEQQTELERKVLISHLFIPVKPDVSDISIGGIARMFDYAKVWSRWDYLKGRGLGTPEIDSFLQSQELASIPMVDIQARLWGHLMVNSARRLPRGSDREDIEIMAMTLPYCDIVTTDSYMQKVVVEDLKLADSYRTKVLSCRLKDVEKLTVMLAN
jgi:hypothetical protein